MISFDMHNQSTNYAMWHEITRGESKAVVEPDFVTLLQSLQRTIQKSDVIAFSSRNLHSQSVE